MKKLLLLPAIAVLAGASAQAATLSTTVTKDTYIRNDTAQGTNQDGDADNENLIGANVGEIRALMTFDVSSIISAVNTTGGGNFSNLTINSVTLTMFERRGFVRTPGINISVNVFGSDYVENTATWTLPATGQPAGGTIGTQLFNGTVGTGWDATTDNNSQVLSLNASAFATALQTSPVAGFVNFITASTETGGNRFLSITSDRSGTTSRHLTLNVDYTVVPEPSTALLGGLGLLGLLRRRRA